MKLAVFIGAFASVAFLPDWATLVVVALVGSMATTLERGRGRLGLLIAATLTIVLGTAVYAALAPGAATIRFGSIGVNGQAAQSGFFAMLRLSLLLLLASIARHTIDAHEVVALLARSPSATYLAGTVVRLLPSLSDEARRIRHAQRARGLKDAKGVRAAARLAPVLVPMFVASQRRAQEQARALTLARNDVEPGSVDRNLVLSRIAVLAALALAGRLALVALPGVTLSHFVLFIAAIAYGPRVGAAVGFTSRLAGDLMISGLHPVAITMAPVEALLGASLGLLGRRLDFGQRSAQPAAWNIGLAGATGLATTVLFSVAADTSNWLLLHILVDDVPGAASAAYWTALVVLGIVFNTPAAIVNTAVFATASYPVLAGLRLNGLVPPRRQATPSA